MRSGLFNARLYTTLANKMIDTIVIGAGWSGAVAAESLIKAKRSVLVLEARDRVGGRAQTFQPGSGKAGVDLGCSWIHGYNEGNPTKEIAKEYGVAAHLPKPASSPIYGPDGKLPESEAASLRQSLGDSLSAAHQSAQTTSITPSTPLSSSIQPTPFARTLEVGLGVPLERVSLKYAGWESGFGGSDAAPQGGYEALVGSVLHVSGADVKTGQVVESIELLEIENGNGVRVTTKSGESFEARTVLCTIPLGVLKVNAPTFKPALPKRKTDAIQAVHVGTLEKLLLSYDHAWWPDAAEVGSMTLLPSAEAGKAGEPKRAKEVLDAATLVIASFAGPSLPNPQPTLLVYLSVTPSTQLLALSSTPDEISSAMHALLVDRLAPTTTPSAPTVTALTNWSTDPFSLGATTTPNTTSSPGEYERSPLDFMELGKAVWGGRLGFAGEHTDPENRGSVAGAVVSGQREGMRVKRYLELLDLEASATA